MDLSGTLDLAAALLLVRTDPAPEIDEEYNRWYDTEHVPDRLAVPGFENAQRFVRDEAPRYLALYDVESPLVFDSDEYLSSFQGQRRTPWTARIASHFRGVDRRVYRQLFPGCGLIRTDHPFIGLRSLRKGGDRWALRRQLDEVNTWPDAAARLFEGIPPNSKFARKLAPGENQAGDGELLMIYTSLHEETLSRCCLQEPLGGTLWYYTAIRR